MQNTEVTIGSRLRESSIQNQKAFSFSRVVDLRRSQACGPLPIKEQVLRKLANFQVDYQQLPMNVAAAGDQQKDLLFFAISNTPGETLVLTDDVVSLAKFCQQFEIPFSSQELYFVETVSDTAPKNVARRNTEVSLEKIAV